MLYNLTPHTNKATFGFLPRLFIIVYFMHYRIFDLLFEGFVTNMLFVIIPDPYHDSEDQPEG